ncbi:MAG: alginate lyase family protein [Bradyrhizobiaceae bacterium]|nr:alginate lyase family protein [Bradyrhizobiaceae bacterium]
MNATWYWRRLRRMAPSEVVGRARDAAVRRFWKYRYLVRNASESQSASLYRAGFVGTLPPMEAAQLPEFARDSLLKAAEDVLEGRWCVFGTPHPKFDEYPDWFVDARSGCRAPNDDYAFDIPYRNEDRIGNIKYIWEPSRHHHLTVLAAAYAVSRDERYTRRIADHLQSWWRENPFLRGPHWISGIEIGIRLIAWVWVRRLLSEWGGAAELFEKNPRFLSQLHQHQRWLSMLPSRGSSANNHLVAEAAGQFVAASAFPVFSESQNWREHAADVLRREAVAQTYSSGFNRELATEYQGLVLELFLVAAIEGELTGCPLGTIVWDRVRAMTDALAAILDVKGNPPRQGDGDDASGLLLDAPAYNRWTALLSTGRALFGGLPWWPPESERDLRTYVWTRGVTVPPLRERRPSERPSLFADAGHVYLRKNEIGKEIWCRCDHGPHGFLGIAAHAHADALSIELRVNGINVLADPGTYCYHGETDWRDYFRSTIGHNTLELLGQDQSISGGPFLWTSHAESRLINVSGLDEGASGATWQAEHFGYVGRGGPVHRRTVEFDRGTLTFTINDRIYDGRMNLVPARLAFHFGPSVECDLTSTGVNLSWPGGEGRFELANELSWSLHRGETNPPLGWYSKSFGTKTPAFTLVGAGNISNGVALVSRLQVY